MIHYEALSPDKAKLSPTRYADLTMVTQYPSRHEIEHYFTKAENGELRPGDVIKISSSYYDFSKYYLISTFDLKRIEI